MSEPYSSLSASELLANEGFVKRLACRLSRDEAGAEDLVQDTWLTALERGPSDRSGLRSWLATVLRNRAAFVRRGRSRRAQREARSARPEELPSTAELVERVELHHRLVAAVLELPEGYRDVIVRRFFRSETVVDIARQLGAPEATVRTRLHRALKHLRAKLRNDYGHEHGVLLIALAKLSSEGGVTVPATSNSVYAAQLAAEVLMKKTILHAPFLVGGVLGAGLGVGGTFLIDGRPSTRAESEKGAAVLAHPDVAERETRDTALPSGATGSSSRIGVGGPDGEPRDLLTTLDADKALKEVDLRLLLSSTERLDQIRAIKFLRDQDSSEASALLLETFLTSSADPILSGLLEEALLASSYDVTPELMDAFRSALDPEAGRIAELLTKLGDLRPVLEASIVESFVAALRDGERQRALAARDALIALGTSALDQVAELLVDPDVDAAVARDAANILAALDPEYAELVREKLGESFASVLAIVEDSGLTPEQQRSIREKTQSLAMAASKRPGTEHDALSQVLWESFSKATDRQQASYLAWGVANLKGMSDPARLATARSILDSLVDQPDADWSTSTATETSMRTMTARSTA